MKRLFFAGLMSVCFLGTALANYKITETDVLTTWESVDVIVEQNVQPRRFYSSRDVVRANSRPCAHSAGKPVRVKTHTEVIDHYQVYQPVTVYKPMGTQIQRRVVPVESCNKCF